MQQPEPSESFRARTGRYSLATVQREPVLGPWLVTHAVVGGFWGLMLGLGHQLTQVRFGASEATAVDRTLSVGLTMLGYAALLLVSGGLGGVLLRYGRRRLAIALGVSLLWLVVLSHLLAEAVYVTAGSPFTLGALDFVSNSAVPILESLVESYWGTLLGFALCTSLLALGTARVLSRAAVLGIAPGTRLAAGVVIGAGTLYGLNQLVARDSGAWASVWSSTPELAFLESVHLEQKEEAEFARDERVRPEPGNALTAGQLWRSALTGSERHPNVLLIMLESVGSNHLSYSGYRRKDGVPVTPNIDRLAAGSLRMRRAWTTATHSNYAQMAVLSSLFPRRTAGLDTYKHLDYPRVLLHDFLHALSYRTATISSQDETWQGMLRFETTATPTLLFHARDHKGPLVATGTEMIVPDHLTAERVRRFILARQDEPWGVYVNFQMTHFPYKLPPGVRGPFAPAQPDPKTFRYLSYPESELESAQNRYDNALHYVDQQVGQLYDALAKSDQLDNTIIVLTSDHGELFHQHGMVTHGRSLYEAEARVPLLVHWPSTLRPRASDAPVSHLDILPTLAELIGVAPHPAFQGESFAEPELVDPERKAIFLNIQGMRTVEGIVCWPYKLIKARQQRHPELYDLSRDPREQEDLFFQDSERVSRLEHLLKAQMSAQLYYHHPKNQALREERYAPRLLTCDAPLD